MTITADLLGGVSTTEKAGVLSELKRTYRIDGLSGTSAETRLNGILDNAGIPAVGNEITRTGGAKLFLETRDVSIDEDGVGFVTCVYRRRETDPVFRGGTSLETIETEKDSGGTQITVEHKDVTQGGTISVLDPRNTLEATIVEATNSPGTVSQAWVGFTNSATWNGGAAGEWLCTDVQFDAIDEISGTKVYRFVYQFEKQDGGWDPTVAFIDPETGRPAPGLGASGLKTVTWYPTLNFSTKFP